MKDRTKEILRDGFGSLISNASAIRGAKAGPLWLTIVMFILSIILPIIPMFVAQANLKGSSFLNTYSYGLERYVTVMALDLKDNRNVEFSIDDQHLLSVNENGSAVTFDDYRNLNPVPFAKYENSVTHQYDFILYLSNARTSKEKSTYDNAIKGITYEVGTTTIAPEGDSLYHPNYMVLFEDGVYVCTYANNSTKAAVASYTGDFKTIKANPACLETLLTVKDKEGNVIATSLANDDYVNGVYKNFKKFLDKSYETLKIKNVWVSSAIYLGIFFGTSVLMGFLMWLLTRGKNNPNNYYTPWLTMKIQGRLGLSPALITLIAGFFLTSYAPMIFILTIGLRVMWVSMKELRPIQQ